MGEVHCVWILALITLHSRLLFELLHDFVAVVALQREKCADVVGAFLSVRTCALARFSSEFSVTAIEQGRDGGSFSLRETSFHWSLGRLTGGCAAPPRSRLPECRRDSWMKGCGRLNHLQPLQNSFCVHYVYDDDASSAILYWTYIERILQYGK